MSGGLLDQLGTYGEALHSAIRPVELADVLSDSSIAAATTNDEDPRPPHRRWMYGLVAAVLTLIVIGGTAFVVGPLSEEDAAVTTTPTLPAPPALSATVVTGEADTIPLGDIVAVEDGFVAVEWPYAGEPGMWRSGDGATWSREALPVGARLVDRIEQNAWGYWLMDCCSSSLWWSEDTVLWQQVDLGQVPLPDMTGVEWGVRPSGLSVTDGTVVVQLTVFGNLTIPLHEAVGLQDAVPEWNPETGIVEMRNEDKGVAPGPVEARIRLSAQIDGDLVHVEAVDANTGAEVGTFSGSVSGVSTDQLMAGLATGEVVFDLFAVSNDGETFDVITVPWGSRSQVVARGDTFLVYSMTGPYPLEGEQVIDVWSSSDGRKWDLLGTPSFSDGSVTSLSISEREGTLLAVVGQGDVSMMLRSSDGLDWASVRFASPWDVDTAAMFQTELGWIHARTVYGPNYSSSGRTDLELWFSPDGERWSQLDASAVGIRTTSSNGGSFAMMAVGNRLFVVIDDPTTVPARTMWIIDLEPA